MTERQDIWTGSVQEKSITDQEAGPAGQKQLGAGAGKRFLVLFRIIEKDQEYVKQNKNKKLFKIILRTAVHH